MCWPVKKGMEGEMEKKSKEERSCEIVLGDRRFLIGDGRGLYTPKEDRLGCHEMGCPLNDQKKTDLKKKTAIGSLQAAGAWRSAPNKRRQRFQIAHSKKGQKGVWK